METDGHARARLLARLWLATVVVWLALPVATMILSAFAPAPGPALFDGDGFGLRRFVAALADARLGRGLLTSLGLGLAVAALALPLGLAGALLLDRRSDRASGVVFTLLLSPIAVPTAVAGLATAILWSDLGVTGRLLPALLAEIARAAAFALPIFRLALHRLDPAEVEAARDLGASWPRVLRRLVLPRLGPAAGAAAAIALLLAAVDEEAGAFLGGDLPTFAGEASARLRLGAAPEVDAVGVFALVACLVVTLAAVAFGRPAADRPDRD